MEAANGGVNKYWNEQQRQDEEKEESGEEYGESKRSSMWSFDLKEKSEYY